MRRVTDSSNTTRNIKRILFATHSPLILVSCVLLLSVTMVSGKPHYHFSINGLDIDHQAGTTPNIMEIPWDESGLGAGNVSNSRPAPYPLGNMDNAEPGVGPGVNGPGSKGGLKSGGAPLGTDRGFGFGSGVDPKSELLLLLVSVLKACRRSWQRTEG